MTITDPAGISPTPRTVFISHSTKDEVLVRWLAEQVRAAGHKAWVAEWDYRPGADLTDKVRTALKASDAYLLLLTEDGYQPVYVQHEAALAVDSGKPVIALVDRSPMNKPMGTLAGMDNVVLDRDDLAASTAPITTALVHLGHERGIPVASEPLTAATQPAFRVSLQMDAEFHVTANQLLFGVCALALIVGLIYVINNQESGDS